MSADILSFPASKRPVPIGDILPEIAPEAKRCIEVQPDGLIALNIVGAYTLDQILFLSNAFYFLVLRAAQIANGGTA